MNENVITNLEQVTTEWLAAVLTHSGALTQGSVTSVTIDTGRGNWSTSGSLQLEYSQDAQGERPSRLFIKMVDADTGDGEFFGASEVDYYLRDYVDVPDAPLLRCYDGCYAATIHRYHLLLEDVSASHTIACDKPPTLAYGLALAEAFAILHARWWGTEGLRHRPGLGGGSPPPMGTADPAPLPRNAQPAQRTGLQLGTTMGRLPAVRGHGRLYRCGVLSRPI